jgi:hypothetical protein
MSGTRSAVGAAHTQTCRGDDRDDLKQFDERKGSTLQDRHDRHLTGSEVAVAVKPVATRGPAAAPCLREMHR